MSKKKTATIYDVASAVGVSPSTVSRAFSNPARVSTDTAERIFAAARDLGFRTSGAAYASSDKATRVLCLVVADISNPTFAAMYKGFHKAAHEHGYAVVIANSDESGALEAHTLRRVLPDVDGVALAASRLTPAAILQVEKSKPLVLMNRYLDGHTCVVPDTNGGITAVCRELAKRGHKDVMYLSGPEMSWANAMRWRALQDQCAATSLQLTRTKFLSPDLVGGADAARIWNRGRTSAVVAYNDLMAFGFVRQARRLGASIPDDVSVIGVDDSVICHMADPELSSLSTGSFDIGYKAAMSLIWQAANHTRRERSTIVVPMEFKIRGSIASRGSEKE